jgi:thiol:disulfide interchange protein DsbA
MNNSILNFARAAVAAAVFLGSMAAMSAEPVEGKQYKLLKPAQPTNVDPGQIEVVEVFWYACGHCYLIEPAVESWNKKGRAANVQLIQMPATWNEMLKTHARAFYTVETLGKPELHDEIFREINVRGNRLDTTAKLEDFFVSRGVSKADFKKTYSSFAVESSVRRAEELNRRYQITSTPTFIVNGKYKTDVGMAGSEEKLFETINALAAKETPAG